MQGGKEFPSIIPQTLETQLQILPEYILFEEIRFYIHNRAHRALLWLQNLTVYTPYAPRKRSYLSAAKNQVYIGHILYDFA